MHKVICCVCGTAYSEEETHFPICCYAQSSVRAVNGGSTGVNTTKKSNIVSILVIAILLVAILLVGGYLLLRFVIPNNFLYNGNVTSHQPSMGQDYEVTEGPSIAPTESEEVESTEVVTEEATVDLSCNSVVLDTDHIELDSEGVTYQLSVILDPVDTADVVSYVSSDNDVVTVNKSGEITAVGSGTAKITVSCGDASAECSVDCTFETEELKLSLNRKEITFDAEGQIWILYNGQVLIDKVSSASDDASVATIAAGKVTAVGEGSTIVHATYKDQSVSCIINCDFSGAGNVATGNVSEAVGSAE